MSYRSSVELTIFHNRPLGHDFEDDFETIVKNAGYQHLKTHIGDDLDIKQGTDFTLNDLRLDTTIDFSHKTFMPFEFDTKIPATPGTNFKIGIRHGCAHQPDHKKWNEYYSEFDEPVIVIGFDMPSSIYKMCQPQILENLEKNIDTLLLMADTALDDYKTTNIKDRKDLIAEPLRPNKKYKLPKHASQKYRDYNNLQMSIMADKQDFSLETFL